MLSHEHLLLGLLTAVTAVGCHHTYFLDNPDGAENDTGDSDTEVDGGDGGEGFDDDIDEGSWELDSELECPDEAVVDCDPQIVKEWTTVLTADQVGEGIQFIAFDEHTIYAEQTIDLVKRPLLIQLTDFWEPTIGWRTARLPPDAHDGLEFAGMEEIAPETAHLVLHIDGHGELYKADFSEEVESTIELTEDVNCCIHTYTMEEVNFNGSGFIFYGDMGVWLYKEHDTVCTQVLKLFDSPGFNDTAFSDSGYHTFAAFVGGSGRMIIVEQINDELVAGVFTAGAYDHLKAVTIVDDTIVAGGINGRLVLGNPGGWLNCAVGADEFVQVDWFEWKENSVRGRTADGKAIFGSIDDGTSWCTVDLPTAAPLASGRSDCGIAENFVVLDATTLYAYGEYECAVD